MKLFYFTGHGRAEASRLMLHLGGVPFENVAFSYHEWLESYQARSPTGLCPWLELDDGTNLTESLAIHVYCAKLSGFLPSEDCRGRSMPIHLALARTVELHAVFENVRFRRQSIHCVCILVFCL